MKLALAQTDIVWEDKPRNLAACEAFIQQASAQGADLILFPEMTLTGFSMDTARTGERDGASVRDFSSLAVQYGIHIAFGTVKLDALSGEAFNMLYIVSRDGAVCGEYAKVHPFSFGEEAEHFAAGNRFPTVQLDGVRLGLAICYDLRFPEGFQIMAQRAQCILLCANWPRERRDAWLALLKARAIENQCYIAAVNRCGCDPGHTYAGDSAVIDPNGGAVARCGDKPQLVTVEIDPGKADALRAAFPMRADKKNALYAREYARLSGGGLPDMLLGGKAVIVTGGCGLIGKAVAAMLARQGARVLLADTDETAASALAAELRREYGVDARSIAADITDAGSVDALAASCLDAYGRIDALVNCAYPRGRAYGAKYEDIKLADWKENIDLHLGGSFCVVHRVSKQMMRQGFGKIILMGSIYGVVGPDFSVYEETSMTTPAEYAAIKGALVNFTRYLASYLGKYHITVNCVSPGGIFDNQNPAFVGRYSKKVPLGRMGVPGDIAGGVAFLLCDAADYITGHNLLIDGGWSCI